MKWSWLDGEPLPTRLAWMCALVHAAVFLLGIVVAYPGPKDMRWVRLAFVALMDLPVQLLWNWLPWLIPPGEFLQLLALLLQGCVFYGLVGWLIGKGIEFRRRRARQP